ncbi:MAG: N-acetylglucosamine-6-phosphate deacetylase [Chitinophagaceae bacterium]
MYALKNFCYYKEGARVSTDSILIDGPVIKDILPAAELPAGIETIDLKGDFLTHGFIDLQVNGGYRYFFPSNITLESLHEIYEDHLVYGTTHCLITMITASQEECLRAIGVVRSSMAQGHTGILGLHLEGPFLNMEKRGSHNAAFIRNPTWEELKEIVEAGEGVLKLLTIAPELFDDEMITYIRSKGIVIAAGHSDCTTKIAKASFERGVSCVTHLYNAMSQLNSREPGLVGASLDSDVFAGIIVDGVHCDYTAVHIASELKKGKLFLVSDATLIGNMDTILNGREYLFRNGRYVNVDGNLAGSNITMWHGVVNSVRYAGIETADAFEMATSIPASVLGLSDTIGTIAVNQEANLVVLSKDLDLEAIIVKGVFRKDIPVNNIAQ